MIDNLIQHLNINGKTDSWLNLANQFNILPGASNKQKSDKVRKLFNSKVSKRWNEKMRVKQLIQQNTNTTDIHLVLGCVHVPFHNKQLVNSLVKFIKDYKENIKGFHLIGDFLDLKSLSSHEDGIVDKTGLTLGKEYA